MCHRFSRISKSDFLEARSLIVYITDLTSIDIRILYFVLPFVFGETP